MVITSLGAGGTERSTALLLPALRDLGAEVHLYTLKSEVHGDSESVRSAGIAETTLTSSRLPGRVIELRRAIRAIRPDVVHTAIFDADIAGRLAAAGTSIPVISSLISTPYDSARDDDPRVNRFRLRLVKLIDGWTLRNLVTRIHAVSSGVARSNIEALRLDPHRVTVVERGRHLQEFHPPDGANTRGSCRVELGISNDAFVYLAVGRQEFAKAHDDLVHAFSELASDDDDCHLIIAGRNGSATPRIRQMLDELTPAVRSRVHVVGHRDDIAQLMWSSNAFVHASRYEGMPGVIIEAMAAQLPIIATDLPGLHGVLEDSVNCLLVERDAPGPMIDAMRRLRADPTLRDRLRREAALTAQTRFTLAGSAAATYQMYSTTVRQVGPVQA
jgi:glycosyltransferase involved in cell wall biosynthesis